MDLPDWTKAVILGLVEGLTEFLPVSSTGHLIVFEKWLGFNSEVFTVFIQMGALIAVWWLFRHRLISMLPFGRFAGSAGRRLGSFVLLGFLPILVIGYASRHWARDSLALIAWASIGGGIVILLVERFKPRVMVEKLENLTPRLALLIGLGQCLSLCPGVSRSGATIVVGLILGLSRSVATEFTFLLAVPTMTAATVYELWKFRHDLSSSLMGLLAIGFLVSYIVALIVVKWFIQFVQTHTFEGFAWYRIIAGALLLGLLSNRFFS